MIDEKVLDKLLEFATREEQRAQYFVHHNGAKSVGRNVNN